MEQRLQAPSAVPDSLRGLYDPIAMELERVEKFLRDRLRSDHPFVDQLVKHGFRLGGNDSDPPWCSFPHRLLENWGKNIFPWRRP
jgi:hypothetical protein